MYFIQTRRKTEHWTTEEEMEGPTPLWGLRNKAHPCKLTPLLSRSQRINIFNNVFYTDQKEDGTLDDRRRDGGTNSTLRIKEQGTHLTFNEHDDDDDDEWCILGVTSKPNSMDIISNQYSSPALLHYQATPMKILSGRVLATLEEKLCSSPHPMSAPILN